MNFFSVLLLGLITNTCFAKNSLETASSRTTTDTVFLRKLVFDTVYQGTPYHVYNNIYIDTNRNSENYRLLSDFSFTEHENLDEYNAKIKKRKIPISKISTKGVPMEWIPLYSYQNRYYVYKPSEMGGLMRRIINDSLLIYWDMEGPLPYILESISQTANGGWTVRSKDYFVRMEGFLRPEMLNIYIIDPVNQVAVWEYKSNTEKEYTYELCIPKEKARNFDLIVNDSNEKAMEFDFDKLDFKKLLKKKTGK
jgi:hypothetical protein